MGLSIHYNRKFNSNASLHAMIEEVKDIVEIYKWKYYIYATAFPPNDSGTENLIRSCMVYQLHLPNVKQFL